MPWAIKKAIKGDDAMTVATHGQSFLALETITPIPIAVKIGEEIKVATSNAN